MMKCILVVHTHVLKAFRDKLIRCLYGFGFEFIELNFRGNYYSSID